MPLTKAQSEILRLLASHRDPESYVAGGIPLNRETPRYSADVDLFHSGEERLASAATADIETLHSQSYSVRWIRRLPAIYTAEISGQTGATRLEWVVDSEYRFFPVLRDETFGYVLHPIDPTTVLAKLRTALDEAEAFVSHMPTAKLGLLFLHDGKVVQPDPSRLDTYETHAGRTRGHWPGSTEISSAMLEHCTKPESGSH
ncbi:MAG: hypothetical protein ACLGXA_05090 [Acidobacteriota bacterium]